MSSGYNTIKKMVYELFEIRKKKDLEKDSNCQGIAQFVPS
jgi:hypothetical protein